MKKRLDILIENTCHNCPFCVYDSHYTLSNDSGYDCEHPNGQKRIADDYVIEDHTRKIGEWLKSQETLFPMAREGVGPNPMGVPKWCPLPDA